MREWNKANIVGRFFGLVWLWARMSTTKPHTTSNLRSVRLYNSQLTIVWQVDIEEDGKIEEKLYFYSHQDIAKVIPQRCILYWYDRMT